MQQVAVLGAGVAGLTAADELSQRHFEVDVFERRELVGGKAKSFPSKPLPGLGRLPAEQGFRFFAGFYRHLPETMRNIPYRDGSSVYSNLAEARHIALLRTSKAPVVMPASSCGFLHPEKVQLSLTRHPFMDNFGLNMQDLTFIEGRLLEMLGTCRERRLAEDEAIGWLEYCGATKPGRMGEYRTMMLTMTRSLVAARAQEMSARTGGDILLQLQLAWSTPGAHPDRVLNGPTSEVWIGPWREKLEGAGVTFYTNHEVTGFDVEGPHLTAVRIQQTVGQPEPRRLTGYDWYVCALPVEIMTQLVDDALKEAAPSLANLGKLITRWMAGFMLYLRRDTRMVKGHSIYIDSPWALTSVSQAQFWPDHQGWIIPGSVEGILSVDISDWETAGRYVGKPARDCTPEEICKEVLGEIRDHSQGADWEPLLADLNIAGYFVDPDIYQPNPRGANVNLEPLFINTASSWASRPQSQTEIDNLVLAADYVRTATDLATMEGANEAARRAVNCILDRAGSSEPRCKLWVPDEPRPFSVHRYRDRNRFRSHDLPAYTRAHDMLRALGIEH